MTFECLVSQWTKSIEQELTLQASKTTNNDRTNKISLIIQNISLILFRFIYQKKKQQEKIVKLKKYF